MAHSISGDARSELKGEVVNDDVQGRVLRQPFLLSQSASTSTIQLASRKNVSPKGVCCTHRSKA